MTDRRFNNSSVEDLKSQLNIVDVIGRVVPLKRAGANFKGCCPFHNEKTPSFIVSEQKQIFTCFGCGVSGNVINFEMKYYGLEFREACEKLGRENGIEVQFGNPRASKEREKLYEINKEAALFFYKAFSESANPGYTYMKGRGLEDGILKKFGIGYADKEWDSLYRHLTSKGYDAKTLMDLGLISHSSSGDKYYDRFRNRVIFPIINTSGNVIGFGGRRIDENDNPKYLNSPENLIFSKKNNLYALNITKQEIGRMGSCVIVEGYMDVISLYQHGVTNVSASLGTALTENQAKLLKRYTQNVYLCYDSDQAGQNAAFRGIDILKSQNLKVKVFHVTDGKDPDEYAKAHGKDGFMKLADQAVPAIRYKLNAVSKGLKLNTDEGKLEYIKRAKDILDGLSPIEADIYIKALASELRISENAIRKETVTGTAPKQEIQYETKKDDNSGLIISPMEASVLKAIFTNNSLTEKLFVYPDILSNGLANRIEAICFELYGINGAYDITDIFDRLDPEESLVLDKSLKDIIIAGREETVLDECIDKFKTDNLRQKQKFLIDQLSLADESNTEIYERLTRELMEVQTRLNQRGR